MFKAMLVGCGKIAGIVGMKENMPLSHAAAYRSDPHINLVACYDLDPVKAGLLAQRYNCEAVATIQEGIEKFHPHVISVCTPDVSHFEVTKKILNYSILPKVIFLEKPACGSQDELDSLIALAEKHQVQIIVNHSRRFDEHHQILRRRISKGELGTLVSCEAVYYSGWQHNGVHVVDTLSFLFDDIVCIEKITSVSESPYLNDPSLEVQMYFKNKAGCITLRAFDEKYYQLFDLDFRFEAIRLRIEDFGTRISLETKSINDIGEHVLTPINHGLLKTKQTSMQSAIKVIVNFLSSNDLNLLHGYSLQDIAGTMKTIWEGATLYATESKTA